MFHIVLFQPEIPPNTGNVIRLAANTGCSLHLVKPLGFELDDKRMRRAGLDYHEFSSMQIHESWADCQQSLAGHRFFAMTTKGSARHDRIIYEKGDVFVFGPETRGLPEEIRAEFAADRRIRLPMMPDNRSLNLSNAVAITVFEAWRQMDFAGAS
ncbi:tRNA (uridine(34)/cytosine(34)/5-carboxymethylaminomethyluridine(34)-2'-O)-methyltransferase TrmL [Iodobacter sp. LRB]|uniref:tRNA (uridine(34)/cytosine(34)/5- carboxymethylaminomethyluridine(34)-2'-O)- methyltransferase TrmL n=1 Tax=unclassified Iodobacter TaxID=235634 RepID=UPI000C107F74|nr:tRNA (uridine(34)/cytosine(34)/5-carboxymethylaminomethyluridine(34)-2'-O)-methyltransferase TrmL [Iodobacter sp. BJB302]PHV02886.1 tRNA (uridine(34)/cytosine(34)/5-carboxymethylaminomethyluridine(34)-2'-O)-methyltransferase TrmL [Iodobacter sp. BJB302]